MRRAPHQPALPVLLAMLAVLAGACSRAPAPGAAAAPAPDPSPTLPPVLVAPLTGLDLDEPSPQRPVLAAKVDNAPAALPPQGLHHAEVVIEEEVEGGITRLIALFHDTEPGIVGPVRSGREVDADLMPAFEPVFVLSGGAPSVARLLEDAGVTVVRESNGDGFSRDAERPAPHNLFVDTAVAWEAGTDLPQPRDPVWAFDDTPPAGGRSAERAELVFSPATSATWSWSPDDGVYTRDQNGSPHLGSEGEQVQADNVVVMRVDSRRGDRRDSAGSPTLALDVIGEGEAMVLRDGRAYPARWRKRSADDQLEWVDAEGEPLPLRPGRTWVELLKTESQLEISDG